MFTFGSLFSGIGGMDLGLERAGMTCRWQVEIDPFCNQVLERHWPNVKRYGDIRQIADLESVDLIAGGFPCQDVSQAGRRVGVDGERTGLYREYVRLIRLLRPRFVLMENVAGLLLDGLGSILRDLANVGYDAEWSMLSACALGFPHTRARVFIVAYPNGFGLERAGIGVQNGPLLGQGLRSSAPPSAQVRSTVWDACDPSIMGVADGDSVAPHGTWKGPVKALGNAVVPQVAEWIGRRILEAAQ